MNNKFAVIDVPLFFEDYEYFTAATSNDPVVVTGSSNWTSIGFDLNDETMVVVHDLTLGYRYAIGEANALLAAAANSGVVYGEVRSSWNNIGLSTEIIIESERASAAFPGTPEPVETESDADDDGFYGAFVTTGNLIRLEAAQPEGHLVPTPKFQYGNTFLLLPGASYEGNFFAVLAPTGTGTGGT
jgi:phosphatidylserine/phosphatidylglycerophosphate/cardiolipin synthase-like enzyme